MKKKLNSCLLLGTMLFCLSTLLTSCDLIFDEEDNPVSDPVTPPSPVVDDTRVLGAALETGAKVSVTYTVGSISYVATFVKNSDNSYTLQSNNKETGGLADPAVTIGDGATVGDQVQLLLADSKLKLMVKASNGNPLFEATMKIETGETAIINTNALGVNCAISLFAVNGNMKDIKNPKMQHVTINFTYEMLVPGNSIYLTLPFNYAVQYLNGETWADVIARYKASDHGEISTTNNDFISITFTKDLATEVVKAAVSQLDYNVAVLVTPDKIEEMATTVSQNALYLYTPEPVRSTDIVDGNETYALSTDAPVIYKKCAWDDTEKKVVFTNEVATTTVVQNAYDNVTWSNGWYTVSGDVTINGDVLLGADTHLILQDGAKLTINGFIYCSTDEYDLYIFGQAEGTGKLNVICSDFIAINGGNNKTIEIHGGEITAESYAVGASCSGLFSNGINIYGGKLTATSTAGNGSGIRCETFSVYGGEVIAEDTNTSSLWCAYGIYGETLTVYGGKVQAAGNGVTYDSYCGQAIEAQIQSGTEGIKFYFSDDNTNWDAGTTYSTATAAPQKRYAKVE